jgi:hypothetical protein
VTDRRTIPELRAHADKVQGYGHLVAHEMVDEIEELRQFVDHAAKIMCAHCWTTHHTTDEHDAMAEKGNHA